MYMKTKFLILVPLFSTLLSGCSFLFDTDKEVKEYYLTQSAEVGNITFVVNNVSDTKHIGSSYGKDTDANFVILNITFTNNGSEEETIFDSQMKYYVGNNKYEVSIAGSHADSGFCLNISVGAGLKKTANVVFEIPSTHTENDYLSVSDGGLFASETAKIWMKTA